MLWHMRRAGRVRWHARAWTGMVGSEVACRGVAERGRVAGAGARGGHGARGHMEGCPIGAHVGARLVSSHMCVRLKK